MHGASTQSWRDLCVRLSELGLFLSLRLPNQLWICQSCCGRYMHKAFLILVKAKILFKC